MGMQGMLARSQMKQMLEERDRRAPAAAGPAGEPASSGAPADGDARGRAGDGAPADTETTVPAAAASSSSPQGKREDAAAATPSQSGRFVDCLIPSPEDGDPMLSIEVKKLVAGIEREDAWRIAQGVAAGMRDAAARVREASERGTEALRAAGEWTDASLGVEWVEPAPASGDAGVPGGEGWGLLRYVLPAGSPLTSLLEDCVVPGRHWVRVAGELARRGSQYGRLGQAEAEVAVMRANPCAGFGEPEDFVVRCGEERRMALSFRVRSAAMQKLRTLHGMFQAGSGARFLTRAFAVVARYEALARTTSGSQGAVTHAVFDWLVSEHVARAECFASPLNCYLPRYCSAFPDVDAFFGSLGSFFDLEASAFRGTYECNPPFTSELMLACVKHCVRACERADELDAAAEAAGGTGDGPLTFVVFTPAWTDDEYVATARASACLTTEVRVPRTDHEYRDGMQHSAARAVWSANVDSLVFLIQSRAGKRDLEVRAGSDAAATFRAELAAAMRRREDASSELLCPMLVGPEADDSGAPSSP